MGYLEAAVVVYLRALSSSSLTQVFPLTFLNPRIALVEILREASTIIMLGSVASVDDGHMWQKFLRFSFMFGIWDISYYAFLKIITGWPDSLFDFDVLFLIPIAWIGPVIAPILISILLSTSSIIILKRSGSDSQEIKIGGVNITFFLIGSLFVLFSFLKDAGYILYQSGAEALKNWRPTSYGWTPFVIGFIFMLISVARTVVDLRKITRSEVKK